MERYFKLADASHTFMNNKFSILIHAFTPYLYIYIHTPDTHTLLMSKINNSIKKIIWLKKSTKLN